MEKRHIISLQGRDFCTYEGILDEAHNRGLKSIRTTLVQVPDEHNGQVAICTAEVELVDADGTVKLFTGIGDANPKNVSRNIVNHLIRMAETRSKARALRDAINVGMTAYEELEAADLPQEQGSRKGSTTVERAGRAVKVVAAKAAPAPAGAKLATRAEIDTVTKEMKRTGFSQEQGRTYLQQHFNKTSRLELTGEEIAKFTTYLQGLASAELQEATV